MIVIGFTPSSTGLELNNFDTKPFVSFFVFLLERFLFKIAFKPGILGGSKQANATSNC